MKKVHFIILFLILLFACKNNVIVKNSALEKEYHVELLDSILLNAIKDRGKERFDHGVSHLAIYFTDSVLSDVIGADSAVFISPFDEKSDYPAVYYQGVIDIDSCIVVIFDQNHVGLNHYDRSRLIAIPFAELKKTDLEVVMINVFKVKNDSLERWIGP